MPLGYILTYFNCKAETYKNFYLPSQIVHCLMNWPKEKKDPFNESRKNLGKLVHL
jgi:hypothetical protein